MNFSRKRRREWRAVRLRVENTSRRMWCATVEIPRKGIYVPVDYQPSADAAVREAHRVLRVQMRMERDARSEERPALQMSHHHRWADRRIQIEPPKTKKGRTSYLTVSNRVVAVFEQTDTPDDRAFVAFMREAFHQYLRSANPVEFHTNGVTEEADDLTP